MSKNYTQLSLEQRYQIEALWKLGTRQKEIASVIGVHPSTISREYKRNIAHGGRRTGEYDAERANLKTGKRHKQKTKQVVFTERMKQWALEQCTKERWSPEQIAEVGKRSGKCAVSHEWLYQWIWRCKHSHRREDAAYHNMWMMLRHARRRSKRGGKKGSRDLQIPERVCITKRPKVVDKRRRLGDIEMDLMMGKRDKGGAVLVIIDRASLYTQLIKLPDKTAKPLVKKARQRLSKLPFKLRTITMDNDSAFMHHLELKDKLSVKTYFTRPYTSQDKGSVENRIGVVRRFIPKKTDLTTISASQLMTIQNKINSRPVKKFDYLTPNQVLKQKIALMS
jgi:transposase, IS30 family